MDSKVYQCCYTNAIRQLGDTRTTGWQTVSVSPDIPHEAYAACSKLQIANSSIQSVPTDENGDVLKLTEIYGDGSSLYVLRTVYGLMDDKGRPNMFSHAYIFPLAGGLQAIQDPNLFLSLDERCFKDSEEAAESWDGRLAYLEPLTLETALARAGLDREKYIKLIHCVYAQLSEKRSTQPLYVQYDGTAENMRAILYCVYYGLPYGIRRSLKIASCPSWGDASKNLVFSRNAGEKGLYVDPASGEENILTGAVEKRIARNGFIDHAVRDLPYGAFGGFFSGLDQMTASLGDPLGKSELTVRLAYTLLEGGDVTAMSEDGLERTLSDTLRLKPTSDERVCSFIAQLVGELDARRFPLSDEIEQTLSDWITSSGSDVLRAAGTSHSVHRLFSLTDSEAVEKLASMSQESRAFYTGVIRDQARGQEILRLYFDSRLAAAGETWAGLHSLLDDAAVLDDPSALHAAVLQRAEALYAQGVSLGADPVENLVGYRDVMMRVLPQEETNARGQRALEAYWSGVNYDNFSFDKAHEYISMRTTNPQCSAILNLIVMGAKYREDNETEFFLSLRRFLRDPALSAQNREKVLARLREVVASRAPERAENFDIWADMASSAGTVTQLNALLALRAALMPFDAQTLIQVLQEHDLSEFRKRRSGAVLFQMLYRECTRNDLKDAPLPLDLWLRLGSLSFNNPFDIFNKCEGCVLSASPAAVVRDSQLMKTAKYRTLAENYVLMKGDASKAVKRWLSEARDTHNTAAPGGEAPRSGYKGLFGKK